MEFLREMGAGTLRFLEQLGALTRFFGRLLLLTPGGLLRFRLVVEQVYNTGAMSLVIIMTCGLFVGMVLGLQGYDLLQRFGSEESLGTGAALALLRELGPVVTALLFAGRAGTALASELGLMRATDQLSAMEIMAVDPMRRVVLPRFLGGVISMPLLTAVFVTIGIFGVQLVGVQLLGVDEGQFWSQMRSVVEAEDVREGVRRRLQPDRGVRRLQCGADRRGRGPRNDAHGRHLLRAHARAGLRPDGHFLLRISQHAPISRNRYIDRTVRAARICGDRLPGHADHEPGIHARRQFLPAGREVRQRGRPQGRRADLDVRRHGGTGGEHCL